ncbi:MAG TPA: glycoside hydrolase family 9 protein [Vicinamibacteria bacterium]|nr:glycoside hydrolase family 9 protein [Vicinamibacteria bacterium]
MRCARLALILAGALLASPALAAPAAPPTTDVKVSQAGYPARAAKRAFVVSKADASTFAVVRSSDGARVFEGRLSAPAADADSGDAVRTADFSPVEARGRYALDVPGVGRSFEFAIGDDVFSRPLYLAMRSFYGQRCGAAVDLGPEFPGYRYPACHREGAWHASSGRQGPRPSVKGWHDAGDYGRYVVNSGITTGTLLWAFEMFPGPMKGLRLDIPESGDQVPDVLDEVRWNLEWMLSMQGADGGAFHKQTSERFPGFVMPQDDASVSYAIGTGTEPWKGTCATADLAAVAAVAARAYRPHDAAFADTALRAARRAWAWAEAHPAVTYRNPPQVSTGAYGDGDCRDELLWAAAELWRTSGDAEALAYFLDHERELRSRIRPDGPPAWPDVAPLAFWTYALASGGDEARRREIREASLAAADAIVARSAAHGYRISLVTADYVWGSNAVAANYGLQLLVANALRPDRRYVEAARDDLYYLLGRNAFSLSWVTQVGENPFRHPHHRPSGADANAEPWPGLLSGGPNRRKQDLEMQNLPDGLPPARMYVDAEGSYATNENAINWNAALVFLLAGAGPTS